jgi:DNA repair protein RadC
MKEAARLLEISLLDHLIFTNNGFFSFADENLL